MRKILFGTFRILPVGYFPHSALSGEWSLHGTLAIDMYVHVHNTLFKLIFACMYVLVTSVSVGYSLFTQSERIKFLWRKWYLVTLLTALLHGALICWLMNLKIVLY